MATVNAALKDVAKGTAKAAGNYLKNQGQRAVDNAWDRMRAEAGDLSVLIPQNIPGLGSQIGSIDYTNGSKASGIMNENRASIYPGAIGYKSSQDNQVPDQYLVRILSSYVGVPIVAILQDNVNLRVSSKWEPFLPQDKIPAHVQAGFQLATNKSLVSRFTSRRVWMGTEPVSIMLNLRFEAIYNAKNEVVLPCLALQEIVLPSEGDNKLFGKIDLPVLDPPGPSPYLLKDTPLSNVGTGGEGGEVAEAARNYVEKGDNIRIEVGRFLAFEPVIVESCNVTYDSRVTTTGEPISAVVEIVFQTYEVFTKKKMEGAYNGGARSASG